MDLSQFGVNKKKKKSTLDSLLAQIQNDKTPIASVRVDTTPKQSAFGKWAHLDPKNNWFFDALDLASRPGKAIENVIYDATRGGTHNIDTKKLASLSGLFTGGTGVITNSVLPKDTTNQVKTDLWRGFSGQDKVSGSKIENNLGFTVSPTDSWKKKALHGIGGFGIDVATDPLTFVDGVGALLKGGKALSKAAKPLAQVGDTAITKALKDPSSYNTFKSSVKDAYNSGADTLSNLLNFKKLTNLNGVRTTAIRDTVDPTLNRLKSEETNIDKTTLASMQALKDGFDSQIKDLKVKIKDPSLSKDQVQVFKSQIKDLQEKSKPKNLLAQGNDLTNVIERNHTLNALVNGAKQNSIDQLVQDTKKALENSDTATLDQLANGQSLNQTKIDRLVHLVKTNPKSDFKAPTLPENLDPYLKAQQVMHESRRQVLNGFGEYTGKSVNDPLGDAYVRHTLTKNALSSMGKQESSGFSHIGGNQQVVAGRQLDKGSIFDRNQNSKLATQEGVPVNTFETNAFKANNVGDKQVLRMQAGEKIKNDFLSNPEFAREIKPGEANPIPKAHQEKITTKDGKTYLVAKQAYHRMQRYQKFLANEDVGALLKGLDKAVGFWKKTALFSVAFHGRNLIGNAVNMYLAGMNPVSVGKSLTQATKDLPKARNIEKDILDGVKKESDLTVKERTLYTQYKEFQKRGLADDSIYKHDIQNNPEKGLKKAFKRQNRQGVNKLLNYQPLSFTNSQHLGMTVDTIQRFALFRWGLKKYKNTPSQVFDKAAQTVKDALFDYGDLSAFETHVMRRLMPFYTWVRKNSEYQIRSFVKHPEKYNHINQLFQEQYQSQGIDQKTLPSYMKDNFYMPFGTKSNGDTNFITANLPITDLINAPHPLKTLVNSSNPLLKIPYELTTNTNSFTGRPIESFKGQTTPMFGGKVNLPSRDAYLLSQLGAVRNLSQKPGQLKQGDVLNALIGNLSKKSKASDRKTSATYDEVKRLDDLLKLYQQQTGQTAPTINDLKKLLKESQKNSFSFSK